MTLTSFAICGPGLVRAENQDNLYVDGVYRENMADNSVFRHGGISAGRALYAVADGMGGEAHGALAALVTVQDMNNGDFYATSDAMTQYINERNAVICDLIKENGGLRIGSTFAGLCVDGAAAVITNIGDSRIYHFCDGSFEQLSRDHTLIRQMLELGMITKEAALTHPDRHKLTQHLGIFPDETIIEPYTVCVDIKAGDIFLLCSDGLTDMLNDKAIKSILGTRGSVEEKAETLFAEALKNGGKDNITVMLVRVDRGKLFCRKKFI